jgi:hypothetical protein
MDVPRKKKEVTFLKKSNQKTFVYGGRWHRQRHGPQGAKVFLVLFLQKKNAFLTLYVNHYQ